MTGYQGLIQPIVLRRAGTHEEMVRAAARASVAAYLSTPEDPAWQPWLSGSFGKTVRRARPVEVEKAREFFVTSVQVGDAEAFACLPYATDEVPAPIKKMQVSGTEAERKGWLCQKGTPGPHLYVNAGASMSTGKTCAQVAHGLFGWALLQTRDALGEWQEAGMPFKVTDMPQDQFEAFRERAVVVIEDAGHTEVDPGTATVLALN